MIKLETEKKFYLHSQIYVYLPIFCVTIHVFTKMIKQKLSLFNRLNDFFVIIIGVHFCFVFSQ